MIQIKRFTFNPFQVNTFVLYSEPGDGYIIDAACSTADEEEQIYKFLELKKITPKALINTHCHVDHLLGVENLRKNLGVAFSCSKEDQFLIDSATEQGDLFGLNVNKPSLPDKYLSEEDNLQLGDETIHILHVPGHSPGSLVFHLPVSELIVSGDVLFSGSIGRSDLPRGDHNLLIQGIREKLLSLSDNTKVFPGHGPETTIGKERSSNPFLQ